ncbi:dinucleotide-utilizing enzyme possibly involved in molybdopterin or thiamin biosynthesis [Mycolicibacterium chubuense NBB4]|uniref:Dinucleotide-utilizing enzyme possibly involved in molybdopterin or thiamin biosynthesis n=1 Tax=Mycolicibacterium chubuense (strain NBB4) TaxID=710421 RepID=I4BGU6_MYCCN|nr:Rv1355c family protein [Mycolicibacterium chubuense]AFM16503.1 dinucleotide-utilizing enzyme possibly involved in molybdopterin or thiamin biosynthesis [Mycolicibacterium chubuense NBB4]
MTFEHSETPATAPAGLFATQSAGEAVVLDPDRPGDGRTLEVLRADPAVEVLDSTPEQAATLAGLLPHAGPELISEPHRWAYYPWRRALVGILGPRAYARVRADRNRNLITSEEQQRLSSLRVGVVGLSVGHAIAHTLVMQGLCGMIRLADFDDLELSNLNRVPATVFDIGVNKARVAARRIAEIDPYAEVRVLESGLTADTIGEFLDGLDIVIEECDSLDVKALLREAARARRQPVLMATSDRGLVDVERFDLEPDRPIFHGLLGDLDAARLAGLDNREKIPHVLRLIDGKSLSARGAASLVEVGQSLSTWPQLVGDVLVGASAVAEAVRRIGLGEALSSGRVRVDVAAALDALTDPTAQEPAPPPSIPADDAAIAPEHAVHAVALAASRAPSGGNSQPWHIEASRNAVTIQLAPQYATTMDVGMRGSAVAVGAAVFNARVAAAAHGILGAVRFSENDSHPLLEAVVELAGGGAATDRLAALYPMLDTRETNRRPGTPSPLSREAADALRAAARTEGARLELVDDRTDIDRAGALLAEADRIRYLTPKLHAEMAAELKWPGQDSLESGIDVRSLELHPAELVTLDILRRPEVMALLGDWDAGAVLGADTRVRVSQSSALAVVVADDLSLSGYARGGAAAEAVWLTAQQHGLAVQPISPPFLFAHDTAELGEVAPAFASSLGDLRSQFRHMTGTRDGEAQILVFRLTTAPRASTRSRRRPLENAVPPVF